jgi:hypothetical protein
MRINILQVVLAAMLSVPAHAGTFETLDKIAEGANVANGGAAAGKYDMKTFSIAKKLAELKKVDAENESDCKYTYTVGRRNALNLVESDAVQDENTAEALKKLHKKKLFKTAITREWDGQSGDSEYCMIYEAWFFTVDGIYLFLEYNFTT